MYDKEELIEIFLAVLTRMELINWLELEGFQCYDNETREDLAAALADHCITEDIDPNNFL